MRNGQHYVSVRMTKAEKENFLRLSKLCNAPEKTVLYWLVNDMIVYVVESRFQKPDYKKPRENTLLNNRIGNYRTSDFADLPSVDTDNIINTEYDCTAAGKEENNAAEN